MIDWCGALHLNAELFVLKGMGGRKKARSECTFAQNLGAPCVSVQPMYCSTIQHPIGRHCHVVEIRSG